MNRRGCLLPWVAPHLDVGQGQERDLPIHDALVTVTYQGRRTDYRFFFRAETHRLPINRSVQTRGLAQSDGTPWRGDIIVMKRGEREEFVGATRDDLDDIFCALRK